MTETHIKRRTFPLSLLLPVFLVVILGLSLSCEAGPKPAPLYRKEINRIVDPKGSLAPFYEKLALLRKGQLHRVTVLHIGDSHIQPGSLTSRVSEPLQALFGNAGRGLCFPYRLARTNGPSDYRVTSNANWSYRRSVRTDIPLPVGLMGFTVRADQKNAFLDISLLSERCASPSRYGFDNLIVFREKGRQAYELSVADQEGGRTARKEILPENEEETASKFSFNSPGCHAVITAAKTADGQNFTQIYGLSLERLSAGVLYHTAGVNGAAFEHFSESQYFSRHLTFLKPDLVIVSLGANNAFSGSFREEDTLRQVETLYRKIKSAAPNAVVLFTTPPDAGPTRKNLTKSNIMKVRGLISAFCAERRIAYWDLYDILGGYGSISKWRRNGLVQSDMIHFTRTGYEVQGGLLFEAIIQGFRVYESDRLQ